MTVERFAPSPTGLLHLGHAYSAALAWRAATRANGRFLLRMEDLDRGRCRPEFYAAIEEDLMWLGLDWSGPVLVQSNRMPAYEDALACLDRMGLLFRCDCTRKDLQGAVSAPQERGGVESGEAVYPGFCREKSLPESSPHALRLNMRRAMERCGDALATLSFRSQDAGGALHEYALDPDFLIQRIGDVVLRRKDGAPAYHLAVVVDDAYQDVTHVTRGEDLLEVTHLHRLLQFLLDLRTPTYFHHDLIRDEHGKRLAKRDNARSIRNLREHGHSRAQVYEMISLTDPVAQDAG